MDSEYVSLTTGARRLRLRPRRVFYAALAAVCSLLLLFLVLRSRRQPRPEAARKGASSALAPYAAVADEEPAVLTPFVPTAEWRDIPHGAVLPAGCEIDINFQTGVRRARLRPGEPAHSDLPVPVEPAGEGVHEPTEIERTIAQAASMNAAQRDAALAALQGRAHEGAYGASIVHARNLGALLDVLRSHPSFRVRLSVATVLAAALHNNPAALRDNAPSTRAVVSAAAVRLASEDDFEVCRRLVAVVTYAAESAGAETLAAFAASGGFATLAALNKRRSELDPAFAERQAMLLSVLHAEDAAAGKTHASAILGLVDSVLGLMYAQHQETLFSDMTVAAVRTLCAAPSLPPNLSLFCSSHK